MVVPQALHEIATDKFHVIEFRKIKNMRFRQNGRGNIERQANPRQKNNLHFGNFLNRYAKFIGREYQINTDPLELGKKYFEVFKNYKPYEESLDALKNECRKYRINYNEIFSEYGIVYANSFKEYYDCENRELLESSLATIIPIINQIKIYRLISIKNG